MSKLICPNCGASVADVVKHYHSELTRHANAVRNANSTPEERKARSAKALKARWDKYRANKQ